MIISVPISWKRFQSSAPCRSTRGACGEGSGVPGRARAGAGDPFGDPPGDRWWRKRPGYGGAPRARALRSQKFGFPAESGGTRGEEVRRERADSPAAPREPQLRSRSAQLRAGPEAAAAGGGSAAPSSPSVEPFSPAPLPRLQPPSSTAPAASSAPSFRRFF
uniref:Uncharacterized protein n=2 Tax=Canis lupus familiaris TaxID=9615 RepID=A0A8P0TGI5_CANLF